jgi:hypothetical protein
VSEKRKWFDPKQRQLPIPQPILMASKVGKDEVGDFLTELSKSKKVRDDTYKLFHILSRMSPAHRLSRNLKVLMGLMSEGEVKSVTADGVSTEEKDALINLEVAGVSQFSKTVAQSLLNVMERYQVLQSMSAAFRSARVLRG